MGIQKQASLATTDHYVGWCYHERAGGICYLCICLDDMG